MPGGLTSWGSSQCFKASARLLKLPVRGTGKKKNNPVPTLSQPVLFFPGFSPGPSITEVTCLFFFSFSYACDAWGVWWQFETESQPSLFCLLINRREVGEHRRKSAHKITSIWERQSHKALRFSAGMWYQRLYFLPVQDKYLPVKTGIYRSSRGSVFLHPLPSFC